MIRRYNAMHGNTGLMNIDICDAHIDQFHKDISEKYPIWAKCQVLGVTCHGRAPDGWTCIYCDRPNPDPCTMCGLPSIVNNQHGDFCERHKNMVAVPSPPDPLPCPIDFPLSE